MPRLSIMSIYVVILFAASGCNAIQRLDQWKCDNYGICPNGVQPSHQPMPSACPPQAVVVTPATACPTP